MTTAVDSLDPVAAPEEAAEVQATLLQACHQHCLLVFVSVRKYEGRIAVRGGKVLIEDVEIDDPEFVTGFSLRLLPKDWREEVARHERQARALLAGKLGLSFHRGVYMVPWGKALGALRELKTRGEAFKVYVKGRCHTWEQVVAERRATFVKKFGSAAWEAVRASIPGASEVEARHAMVFGHWDVASGAGVSPGLVPAIAACWQRLRGEPSAETEEMDRLLDSLHTETGGHQRELGSEELSQHLESLRAVAQQELVNKIRHSFSGVLSELRTTVEEFLQRIADGKRTPPQSVAKLQRIWSHVEGLAWMGTNEVRQLVAANAPRVAALSARDLNNLDAVGQQTVESLTALRQLLAGRDDLRSFE